MVNEQQAQEAYDGWQKELMESVKERAKLAGDPPIPDLEEMVFTAEYLEADIALALSYITATMKSIRCSKNWKSSDLVIYKKWRQILLIERNNVRGMFGIAEEAVKQAQEVLQKFYSEVQAKPLNEKV